MIDVTSMCYLPSSSSALEIEEGVRDPGPWVLQEPKDLFRRKDN